MESFDRSVDDVLDELLEALRSDQGGARTEALRRALEQGSGFRRMENERIADLESKVAELSNAVDTDSDVRSELDSITDELASLRAAIDAREATDADLESKVAELSNAVETDSDDRGAVLEDVRAELDSTADELASLRAAIDAREATDAALEARIDDLEAAVTELADRFRSVEAATRNGRSDREAVRGSARSGDPSEGSTERVEDDVARWVQHVEKNLEVRTTALASRLRDIEDLEARIDERTAVLDTEIEDVNSTMKDAITLLREGTKSELSTVKSEIEDVDDELRSSIESLEKDVDALEAHAADMTLWRNSIEGVPEGLGDGRDDEPQ